MAETTWTLPDINSIAEKATKQVAYEYRFIGLTGDAPRVTPAMARIVLEQAGVQPADRDRLAAENEQLAARVRELEAVEQALFGYGHGSSAERVKMITAREVQLVERVEELEALLTDALGRMEKVYGTLEDEDVYMATVNRLRAALGDQAAESEEA